MRLTGLHRDLPVHEGLILCRRVAMSAFTTCTDERWQGRARWKLGIPNRGSLLSGNQKAGKVNRSWDLINNTIDGRMYFMYRKVME